MKKLVLALAVAGLISPMAAAVPAVGLSEDMEIGVRSGIDKAEKAKRDKDPKYAQDDSKRLRLYLLASVKEVKTGENMVRDVSARGIAGQLEAVLQKQGFHAVAKDQKPEIIITALYGRGMIINPYLDPDKLPVGDYRRGVRAASNLSDSVPVSPIIDHKTYTGLHAKTQALNYEKLAIQITAWKYPPPSDPNVKPQPIWQTIVYADDAEHRDLNQVSAKLLESAAPYFDKHIDRESEVKVWVPAPEGHVKVGTPEVVGDEKK